MPKMMSQVKILSTYQILFGIEILNLKKSLKNAILTLKIIWE